MDLTGYEAIVYNELLDEWDSDPTLSVESFDEWIEDGLIRELGYDPRSASGRLERP